MGVQQPEGWSPYRPESMRGVAAFTHYYAGSAPRTSTEAADDG
jgi:hypothetical protein